MSSPLVSIITPCFNGENYIHRFLESILRQTYRPIEVVFVNDGSTDQTESIVNQYMPHFEEKGIAFTYIYQENAGQAAAINKALAIFKGEYLTWPDSDDVLHDLNIEKKVQFLERNPDFGFVLCKSRMVDETDVNKVIGSLQRKHGTQPDLLFEDLLLERNVYFAPGGYMVRSSCMLKVLPSKHINESRAGQNWQLLLPMAYHYRCGYIDEYLYDYVVRTDSHSRMEKNENEVLHKSENHERLLLCILEEMNIPDKQKYIDLVELKYIKKRLEIAYLFENKEELEKQYYTLKRKKALSRIDKKYYYRSKFKAIDYLFRIYHYFIK